MSRFRKSEYRAEKRDAEKPFEQQQDRCEGSMGMCGSNDVAACLRCGKPYCAVCAVAHLGFCRGMR